jgi:hypothetical protein
MLAEGHPFQRTSILNRKCARGLKEERLRPSKQLRAQSLGFLPVW